MKHSERLQPVIVGGRERILFRVLHEGHVRCGLCEQPLWGGDTYTRRKLIGYEGVHAVCEECEPRDELRDPASTIRHPRKRAFLKHYSQTGNVSAAARVTGVERATIYQWKAVDPDFAAAMETAKDASVEVLEAHALRLAIMGDGATLRFLLKALRPELYGDRVAVDAHTQHSGLLAVRPDLFTTAELETLQATLRAQRQRELDEQGGRLALPPGKD